MNCAICETIGVSFCNISFIFDSCQQNPHHRESPRCNAALSTRKHAAPPTLFPTPARFYLNLSTVALCLNQRKGHEMSLSKTPKQLPAVRDAAPLPSLAQGEAGLNRYLAEIKKFPILSPEEEYMLSKRYNESGDPEAAAKLVTSHLRLVAKIAMGYRNYGLPVTDLIAEGNIGLMHGVKKFDPERGFRLSTYAMWWIKASIQEFILRTWSLVKMGTTAQQKKLFFNLRRMKNKLEALDDNDLKPADVKKIAHDLGVSEDEVTNMNRRMSHGGDSSLNVSLNQEGEGQWQDTLEDGTALQDERLAEHQESAMRHILLTNALATLTPREVEIITARKLVDEPKTLEELSEIFNISRERVRQIEVRAFEKLQKAMLSAARVSGFLPA
jgi:RNA polymerase sigma-32 factor